MATASKAFTAAGTTIGISAVLPATYDAAGFTALTFSTIGEVTDIGAFGKKYNLVSHTPLAARNIIKRKGSYDNGQVQLKLAKVNGTDAGQTAVKTASTSDSSVAFKVTLQNGTINYFTGQVMSMVQNVGSADNIVSYDVDVELDNDVIEV